MSTLLDHWWSSWRNDYLTELREHHKFKNRKRKLHPRVNDIVLIADDNLKRSEWRVGRVTKLVHSKDDEIRTVELVTKDKKTKLRRPISRLYPIS